MSRTAWGFTAPQFTAFSVIAARLTAIGGLTTVFRDAERDPLDVEFGYADEEASEGTRVWEGDD
jgi:hypothetical protein